MGELLEENGILLAPLSDQDSDHMLGFCGRVDAGLESTAVVAKDHQSVQVDGGRGVCVERTLSWKHFFRFRNISQVPGGGSCHVAVRQKLQRKTENREDDERCED